MPALYRRSEECRAAAGARSAGARSQPELFSELAAKSLGTGSAGGRGLAHPDQMFTKVLSLRYGPMHGNVHKRCSGSPRGSRDRTVRRRAWWTSVCLQASTRTGGSVQVRVPWWFRGLERGSPPAPRGRSGRERGINHTHAPLLDTVQYQASRVLLL